MESEKYAQYYSTWSINAVNIGGPNGLVLKNFSRVNKNKQNNNKQDTSTIKKSKNFLLFPVFFPELSVICNQLRLKMLNENFQK